MNTVNRVLYYLAKKLDWYIGGLKGRIYSYSVRTRLKIEEQERSNIDD